MFKRICLVLILGTQLFANPTNAHGSSNIKTKDKKTVLNFKTLKKVKKKSKIKKEFKSIKKSKKRVHRKKSNVAKKNKKIDKTKATNSSNIRIKSKYKVIQGDSLFFIARKFKVKIEDITKLNKLGSNTLIHPGDIIKIPLKSYAKITKKATTKISKTVYRVKKNDSLYSISLLYNMKQETLRKLNNLKKKPKLKRGMKLIVLGKPKQRKKREKIIKYVVKKGDSVWKIARAHRLTIAQLKLLNPQLGEVLKIGSIIKIPQINKRSSKYRKLHNSSTIANRIVKYAKKWLGSRYVWGGSKPGAFDCSGFTRYVMKHTNGKAIPRVSRRQAYYGRYISRRNLKPGDLIFFDTSHERKGYVNHVGIYIGHNRFIHASSAKHRVVITSLNKSFYKSRFMWGRRVK